MDEAHVARWLQALEDRHLANLTASETARALRALSSCYVERRGKLASGGALDSAGKRAAFALFYAPLHFLVTREIVRALPGAQAVTALTDLGCGTGAAGGVGAGVFALQRQGNRSQPMGGLGSAMDGPRPGPEWPRGERRRSRRPPPGRARQRDSVCLYRQRTARPNPRRVAASPARRPRPGARVLVIEPIARRMAGWWTGWEQAFAAAGGEAREWRFQVPLPERQRQLGRAAGLDPRELTARSLWI